MITFNKILDYILILSALILLTCSINNYIYYKKNIKKVAPIIVTSIESIPFNKYLNWYNVKSTDYGEFTLIDSINTHLVGEDYFINK